MPVMKRGAALALKTLAPAMAVRLTDMMYMANAIVRLPTGAVLPAIQAACFFGHVEKGR